MLFVVRSSFGQVQEKPIKNKYTISGFVKEEGTGELLIGIGGVAGNSTEEIREVCDEREAKQLESSSQSTTVWDCK